MTLQIVSFDKNTCLQKDIYDLWKDKIESNILFRHLKPQLLTYENCWCGVFSSPFSIREFEETNYEAVMIERKEFEEWHTLNQ